MSTDSEIAQAVQLKPIAAVAAEAKIPADTLEPYGRFKAKIAQEALSKLSAEPHGKLVLVTAVTPTPAGEGKTTTSIGLGDALRQTGMRVILCLREPSLGPCFGMKGGATGGGRSQVAPAADINLHFTGDFHAVTAANNLLAAMIDNHIHHGNALAIPPARVTWRRALDVNDRSLRQIVTGLGGAANGPPREAGFDITAASEVMAVLCLARDLEDLRNRLARIVIATRRDGSLITAGDLGATGAMAALLRDALSPNLVQTLEGTPALVHGGPFANIAHGCNSLIATRLALGRAEVVVTEAGFGADLGAEKFLDIKCRVGGLWPSCAVLVATLRALKMHGGVARAALAEENPKAVAQGAANLRQHVKNLRLFNFPVVVAVNRFSADTEAELAALNATIAELGVPVIPCTHFANGSAGTAELAKVVRGFIAGPPPKAAPLYPAELGLAEKLRTIAQRIGHAVDIALGPGVAARLAGFERAGFGHLPVCIAKTQYSFSADPNKLGAPNGHVLPVREVRLSAGAGFVVAICGEITTMPGLPTRPAAETVNLDAAGRITGLG